MLFGLWVSGLLLLRVVGGLVWVSFCLWFVSVSDVSFLLVGFVQGFVLVSALGFVFVCTSFVFSFFVWLICGLLICGLVSFSLNFTRQV